MKKDTYIIAEIGQNHNGSIELGKTLIDLASAPIFDKFGNRELKKVNAIKLTKRDLTEELSAAEYNRPYTSPHAYADTYGRHRELLELSYEEHAELIRYAKTKGVDAIETLCSPKALQLLKIVDVDKLKVASRDLTNIPLLEALAETKIPVILSTGMSGVKELDNALEVFLKSHNNISILHCISQYPAEYSNLNLNAIVELKKRYSEFTIGFSDHSIGIMAPIAAVTLGAEIVEKHVTLNRAMKGSDHAGSLELEGLWRMTRDIRNLEESFGDGDLGINSSVEKNITKLRRSLASSITIPKGTVITENMLTMLSPGDGFRWEDKENFVGKKAKIEILANTILESSYV